MFAQTQSGTVYIDPVGRPYPYTGWAHVARADRWLLQRVLDALPRDFHRALADAGRMLGAPVRVREAGLELWPAEQARAALRPSQVVIVLDREAGAHVSPILCELATELAARLVDRVLGGDGQIALRLGQQLDELSAGVAGYLAARLCAASGALLRARSVLTDARLASELLEGEQVAMWPLALEVAGAHLGLLRVFIPLLSARSFDRPLPSPGFHLPSWLGALPLQLCAHAARITLACSQLRALAPGDVVVPERSSLAFDAGSLRGHAELHVFGTRHAHYRCNARGRELVLDRIEVCTLESVMSETERIHPPSGPDLAALTGEAPIELCVELARFTLRLDQLGALRPGQVLGTAQPVGQSVMLSAAGRPIARGELVDIEGEIGVRILELAGQ